MYISGLLLQLSTSCVPLSRNTWHQNQWLIAEGIKYIHLANTLITQKSCVNNVCFLFSTDDVPYSTDQCVFFNPLFMTVCGNGAWVSQCSPHQAPFPPHTLTSLWSTHSPTLSICSLLILTAPGKHHSLVVFMLYSWRIAALPFPSRKGPSHNIIFTGFTEASCSAPCPDIPLPLCWTLMTLHSSSRPLQPLCFQAQQLRCQTFMPSVFDCLCWLWCWNHALLCAS